MVARPITSAKLQHKPARDMLELMRKQRNYTPRNIQEAFSKYQKNKEGVLLRLNVF